VEWTGQAIRQGRDVFPVREAVFRAGRLELKEGF
jgi:hypothetical protein